MRLEPVEDRHENCLYEARSADGLVAVTAWAYFYGQLRIQVHVGRGPAPVIEPQY